MFIIFVFMKKLFLLFVLFIFACSSDDSLEDNLLSERTIEGKWLTQATVSNTMYLFEDGVRYTYYCVQGDCNTLFNSYEANDGNHLPRTNPYTFEDNVLTVDLHFGNELVTPVAFKCDGGEAYFENPEYSLFRLNSGCN